MDVRLHRAEERRLMRGFVLSLAALLAGVVLAAILMWWANLWVAGAQPSASRSSTPATTVTASRAVSGGA